MFNSLTGIITGKFPKQVFIDTNGVEWDLCVPDSNLDMLPPVGNEAKIYIYLQHTDQLMSLYGFASADERSVFLDLLKVDGVGPKGAVKIMSAVSSARLLDVLEKGDLEMLEKIPEEFVGVRGLETEQDVQKNKAYLISFITISGLVHDIGKCYIPDTINRQNRSLNTKEYATIRKHSEVGYREAQGNTALKPYADVILGHHKYYDGLHGYPLGYDNTESPIKIIIDITTVYPI